MTASDSCVAPGTCSDVLRGPRLPHTCGLRTKGCLGISQTPLPALGRARRGPRESVCAGARRMVQVKWSGCLTCVSDLGIHRKTQSVEPGFSTPIWGLFAAGPP